MQKNSLFSVIDVDAFLRFHLLVAKNDQKMTVASDLNLKMNKMVQGSCHSSVVSPVPTILRPQVRIPSTSSMLFSICIIEIVMRKGRK